MNFVEGICGCGDVAYAIPGREPRCMTCIRAQHGLTSTPNERFYATPIWERRKRYALPMGSHATGAGLSGRINQEARRKWMAEVFPMSGLKK